MMDLVRRVTLGRQKQNVTQSFRAGDTVEVSVRVKEGEKDRLQIFRGVVIQLRGSGMGKTFTVRKMSEGIGVERTFPFASPTIDKVNVVSRGKVRRAKLFYLRNLRGKRARIQFSLVSHEADGTRTPVAPAAKTPEQN